MPDPMEGPARTRIVALAVLVAVAVPLTIVALAGGRDGGDDEEEDTGIRVERSTRLPELLVYVNPDVNKPERTGGGPTVVVECLDRGGAVVARQDETWPLTDTDQGTLDPHSHVAVNPALINDVERCRVRPADPPLVGPVL